MKFSITLFLLCTTLFLASCSKKKPAPIEIAINPWPGYEFLYLAEKKGFFEEAELNAKLLQLGSLADVQRAYVSGFANGLASTLIEAVQAQDLGGKPLEIVLVPDFSNGGDVIISRKEIKNISELKGMTIGCEVSSLGIYMLQRALATSDLSLSDVNIINVEQRNGEDLIKNSQIDAFVSYPPSSVEILKDNKFHKIFSSAEIPKEVIDTISISKEALAQNPNFVPKLHKVWQMALDYYKNFPEDAINIMAQREGISPEDFVATLSDLQLIDREGQKSIFNSRSTLQKSVIDVCHTLVEVDSFEGKCEQLPNLTYKGKI